MIQYSKIAQNIAQIKDIFNEELATKDSLSLLRYLREKDTDHMTPHATTDNFQYFFNMGDIRWCNDFECEEGNEWNDEKDEWDWDYLYMELKKLGVEVVDWDDEGIYVEF